MRGHETVLQLINRINGIEKQFTGLPDEHNPSHHSEGNDGK